MPTVETNGIKMNYIDTGGQGTPALLIHGFPFNHTMWQPQIDALGDSFRLIVPDLRGCGDSDAPEDRSSYSMDVFANDLKGLIDELGLDKVVLVGLSMGGYISFAFLRKYRDNVAGLVLADTRAEADPPEAIEKRTKQQDQVAREGTSGLIDALTPALLSKTTMDEKPEVAARLKEVMDNPAAGFIGSLEAMKQRSASTNDLAGISVPTLIVNGENDPLMPMEVARGLHEAIGGSELVAIPSAGHISNMEGPEDFNRALEGFLSRF